MLSLVQPHHYYQNFLAQGVGMGLGMGFMFLPALAVTSHYFRARRALAMGIVIAGKFILHFLYLPCADKHRFKFGRLPVSNPTE
jgi:MFS family permease